MSTPGYRRQLAAAFRFVNGQPEIVQPELEEIATPDAGLWLFWLERGFSNKIDCRFMALEIGGLFQAREEAAPQWEQTQMLAVMIRRACAPVSRRACGGLCGCDGSLPCPCCCHEHFPYPVYARTEVVS